jgi:hypothetical protein
MDEVKLVLCCLIDFLIFLLSFSTLPDHQWLSSRSATAVEPYVLQPS